MIRTIAESLLRCTMEQYVIKGGNPLVGEVTMAEQRMPLWGFLQRPS